MLCDPMDNSPSDFSVHWILQARILEWVAISFSRGSFQPRDQIQVSCIAGRFFTIWATRKEQSGCQRNNWLILIQLKARVLSHFSCVRLCDPMDCSVHGILLARILKWVAMLSSRESSQPGIKLASLLSPALACRSLTTSTTRLLYQCKCLDFS